jgi:hypothetical protein
MSPVPTMTVAAFGFALPIGGVCFALVVGLSFGYASYMLSFR